MEFKEKLQELRKQKGLTQEELAEKLYVSRAAVSKWESGRGYPGIDSLKALAKFYSVSIDCLLSSEEVLDIAEKDRRQQLRRSRSFVFGLLDCAAAILFFLPFFGEKRSGTVEAVSIFALSEISPGLKAAFFAAIALMAAFGIINLCLSKIRSSFREQAGAIVSLILSFLSVLLFIMSRQAYAAAILLVFLAIKAIMLIKNP